MSRLDTFNYYNDRRTQVEYRRNRIKVVEEGENFATIEVDLGDVTETHRVPVKYGVCPCCRGRGSVVNPSIDAGGITEEDFERDPGFREDYMAGRFNVTCGQCRGKRVVFGMTEVMAHLPSETQVQLTELMDDDEDFLRVQMAEMSFGC